MLRQVFISALIGPLLGFALAGCAGSASVSSVLRASATQIQTPTVAGSASDSWRRSILRVALPSGGCFKASYPAQAWSSIPCAKAPNLIFPSHELQSVARGTSRIASGGRSGDKPTMVGNGSDFSLIASNVISTATGSFPAVTGVTSVQSTGGCSSDCGSNSYTLQMNSNTFQTAACNGHTNCVGWEQFVYSNPPGSTNGSLFIQNWLINYGSCPSGWNTYESDCFKNSPTSVSVPNQSIANLGSLVETGSAASTGDSIYLSVGSTEYAMKNIESDGITDLSSSWNAVEFNVIGNSGGSEAVFNNGASITVGIAADDGLVTAPTCSGAGTTAETNSLSMVAAPAPSALLGYPSILFEESNVAGGGNASCNALGATQSWAAVPGQGYDIGFGANGSRWLIGINPSYSSYGVWEWVGGAWQSEPGGGVKITVAPQGDPWLVDSGHNIWHFANGAWALMPGSAYDISAGANGSVWIVSTVAAGAGQYEPAYWNGTGWTFVAGGITKIAVDPSGNPWVINAGNQIYHYNGSAFQLMPGQAVDIGVGAQGSVYILGVNTNQYGYGPWQWISSSNSWLPMDNGGTVGGTTIRVDANGVPWILNANVNNDIYQEQ